MMINVFGLHCDSLDQTARPVGWITTGPTVLQQYFEDTFILKYRKVFLHEIGVLELLSNRICHTSEINSMPLPRWAKTRKSGVTISQDTRQTRKQHFRRHVLPDKEL
jgi:hypothetical protein